MSCSFWGEIVNAVEPLKGNGKRFELAGNLSYRGKFQKTQKGMGNLVPASGEFDSELSRFYCITSLF